MRNVGGGGGGGLRGEGFVRAARARGVRGSASDPGECVREERALRKCRRVDLSLSVWLRVREKWFSRLIEV